MDYSSRSIHPYISYSYIRYSYITIDIVTQYFDPFIYGVEISSYELFA